MPAKLLEGVAGGGKTTRIVDYVQDYGRPERTLLITFSRTGRDVMQKYLDDRGINSQATAIHTIDGLATRFLYELGDNFSVLKREIIQHDLLPMLLAEELERWPTEQAVEVPAITATAMSALLADIDFFRAAGIESDDDEFVIEERVADKLEHDWRLVQRLMWAYDRFRASWVAPGQAQEELYEDIAGSETWHKGEQGFRQLSDAVYDLLARVEGSDKLMQWGRRYDLICIDEFHDTNPLQLQFLLGLARGARDVIAVGDRFQNIYAWRGSNTAYVFDEFITQLSATREELNQSYRYAQSVAALASSKIQRDIKSLATHSTSTQVLAHDKLNRISRETVVICQDTVAQVHAAFYFWRHSQHKISYPINHSAGPAILNLLLCLRYAYLLPAKTPILKHLHLDLGRFLNLPHCYLPQEAKQEMLHKPSPETLDMYFSIHLQTPSLGYAPVYSESMRLTLLQWLSENRETQSVYEMMTWFEQSSRLWSASDLSVGSAIAQASWQALKEDARELQYTLAQWPERFGALNRSWSERAGIRLQSVSQAKGREYDSVLVFAATKEGFTQQSGELARNQFYIAITRAKKQLYFLPLESTQAAMKENSAHTKRATKTDTASVSKAGVTVLLRESVKKGRKAEEAGTSKSNPPPLEDQPLKRQALTELAEIKAKLLKRG